jgi:hypothetical protein
MILCCNLQCPEQNQRRIVRNPVLAPCADKTWTTQRKDKRLNNKSSSRQREAFTSQSSRPQYLITDFDFSPAGRCVLSAFEEAEEIIQIRGRVLFWGLFFVEAVHT